MIVEIIEILNSKSVRILIRGLLLLIGLVVVLSFVVIAILINRMNDLTKNFVTLASIFVGLPTVNLGITSFGFYRFLNKKLIGFADNKLKEGSANMKKIEELIEASKPLVQFIKSNSGKKEEASQ